MNVLKRIGLLTLSLCLARGLIAADYYVDPATGSMSNPGTSASPWSTLEAVFTAGKTFVAGDAIHLRDGYHGFPTVAGNNPGNVTIKPQAGHAPTVKKIVFDNASRWVVSGLTVSPEVVGSYERGNFILINSNSSFIALENCLVYSALSIAGWTAGDWTAKAGNGIACSGPNCAITGNTLKNVGFGVTVSKPGTGTVVSDNVVDSFCYDGLRGMADDCSFEYNVVKNNYAVSSNHNDGFQSWSTNAAGTVGAGAVSNVTLRGNTFISFTDPDQPLKGQLQGIGCFDGFYDNWIVENNLVVTDMWHGLSFYGARNCRIANNTVIKNPIDAFNLFTWIGIFPHKNGTDSSGNIVRNNLATSYSLSNGPFGTADHNITVSDYAAYFSDYNGFDFHLSATSPAIDAGSDDAAPTIDLDEHARVSPNDVGCYEFGVSAATARPDFDPPAGSYTGPISLILTSATSGASIRYTTDGSTPTSATGTLYSSPIPVDATATIKAIAYASGLSDSTVASATYIIVSGTAAAPELSPPAGIYTDSQTVTIGSATGGATIRYTVDGSIPTATTGAVYSNPIPIDATTTVKAIACKSGMADSAVITATYTIVPPGSITATAPGATAASQFVNNPLPAQTGIFSVTYSAQPSVGPMDGIVAMSLGSQTGFGGLAVLVRFNTAGRIDARRGGTYTAASVIPYVGGQTYNFRLVVNVPAHTYSIFVTPPGGPELTVGLNYAFRTGTGGVASLNNWAVIATNPPGGAVLAVSNFALGDGQVAAPAFNPAGGTYVGEQSVAIASATSGASIRYTTDGSMPTPTVGTLYTGPIAIGSLTTLNAIAYRLGMVNSAIASAVYNIQIPPVFIAQPQSQTVTVGDSVSFTASASGIPSPGYQWQKDGVDIPGATSETLSIAGIASANAGTYTAIATNAVGSVTSDPAILTVLKAPATVTLADLSPIYDGTPKPVSVTTVPAGRAVDVFYNGVAAPPTNAGSYAVVATIDDPDYFGSASGTLVISPAAATITLGNLVQPYGGAPKPVSAVTIPAGLNVSFSYDGSATPPIYPGFHDVAATIDEPNYVGSVNADLLITITALVRHMPTLNGNIDGSVQILLPENVTLNGSSYLSGDLLVPGTPTVLLNGQSSYAGLVDGTGIASPANHKITLNGQALLRYLVRRIDPIAMPEVAAPVAPTGTRDVALNHSSQTPGDFATLRNLTLNGNVGPIAVPPGAYGSFIANGNSGFVFGVAGATEPAVYDLQSLMLNGNSSLQIVGPVILRLASALTLNGSAGSSEHPEWLTVEIHNGGLTLNGNVSFHGSVIAPSGPVTVNGNCTLNGQLAADRLLINGNGLLHQP